MRNALKLLFLLMLSSCGPIVDVDWHEDAAAPVGDKIDPDLTVFVNDFTRDRLDRTGVGGRPYLVVGFATLGPESKGVQVQGAVVGECWGREFVFIDKDFWESTGYWCRKGLMYHELGHCVLGLDHVDGVDIMAPTLLSCSTFQDNWDVLVDDLFDIR